MQNQTQLAVTIQNVPLNPPQTTAIPTTNCLLTFVFLTRFTFPFGITPQYERYTMQGPSETSHYK